MARDTAGTYTLPAGNPVAPGTVITSAWANTTMTDIAGALTDSLDRNGRGPMLASLRGVNGASGSPSFTFSNEPNSGLYRAGAGDVRFCILGQDKFRWTSSAVNGAQYWDSAAAGWRDVGSGSGGGSLPPGTQGGDLLLWDGTDWLPGQAAAEIITYDPATSGISATNVQDALDETLSGLDTVGLNLSNHTSDINIHFSDAPSNGSEYVRRDNAWVINSGGGAGVPEAPSNSIPYVRYNATWADGNTYFLSATATAADSDKLNGQNASYYLAYSNFTGTVPVNDLSGTYNIDINGNAATATNATNADSATSAGFATTAGSATTADSATTATNATNADNADAVDGLSLEVRASLPGTPDSNTLYFLTG